MYILRDKDNKIIACANEYDVISDAKISNYPNGIIENTNEEVIQYEGSLYLNCEFEEYKKTEEYKYDKEKTNAELEISRLKKELEEDDYKIIKTFEANLLLEENPYDIETLVSERKAKRKRINELEHQFVF